MTDAADGSALIGVTIQEKGTTNGTLTDGSGSFALTVAPSATLLVSYVGFAPQEIAVNNRTSINVALAVGALNLAEVVVIGYGTVAKKKMPRVLSPLLPRANSTKDQFHHPRLLSQARSPEFP